MAGRGGNGQRGKTGEKLERERKGGEPSGRSQYVQNTVHDVHIVPLPGLPNSPVLQGTSGPDVRPGSCVASFAVCAGPDNRAYFQSEVWLSVTGNPHSMLRLWQPQVSCGACHSQCCCNAVTRHIIGTSDQTTRKHSACFMPLGMWQGGRC